MKRLLLTVSLMVMGCGDDGNHAMSPDGSAATGLCGSDQRAALVAETDYMTLGHAARVDLSAPFSVADGVLALGEDSALKRIGDKIYVLNEAGATDADNLQAVWAAGLGPVGVQTSTGVGSDPSDVAVGDDGRVYVAELEGPGVVIVDLAQGQRVGSIDLSSLDPDGKPNLVALQRRGSLLYAFAALWDDSQQLKPARGPGVVAVIDLSASPPAMVDHFALTTTNPAGWLREEPGTPNVLVATVGDYSGTTGGIERVDLDARRSTGLLVTAAGLGGRYVSDFVVTQGGQGFVSAVDPASAEGQSNLYPFMMDGTVGSAMVMGHVAGLALDACGKLWVVERGYGMGAPNGLRVVDTGTRQELTASPLATSLPPRFWGGIVFVP
jgi:hypothetical protein